MKLSAQLYTVRDFTKTQEDIEQTLKKVKAIGYNSIQVSSFGQFDPYWLGDKVKELGLEVCASHTKLDRIIGDTENVIKEHKAWGCKYIGVGYVNWEKKEDCDEIYAKLETPMKKIADCGLLLVHHNHNTELNKPFADKDTTYLDYLAEKYPANQLGFLMDFYWTTYSNKNALELIEKFKDRLNVVHFKDLTYDAEGNMIMTEIGNGIIDHKKIYDKLKDIGAEFVAIEQDRNWAVSPFDSLKTSYDAVKKLGDFE